jgi:hypothetical protein
MHREKKWKKRLFTDCLLMKFNLVGPDNAIGRIIIIIMYWLSWKNKHEFYPG